MKKRVLRLIVLTLCAAGLMSSIGTAAMAAGPMDLDADVSLTVSYYIENTAIPNAAVSVYRVADTDKWANFTLCGDFSNYKGSLDCVRSAEWVSAAARLADYAVKNKIVADSKGKTDRYGYVTFTDKMEPGLYLVVFGEVKYMGRAYTSIPALICVPNLDSDEEWVYDAILYAKPGVVPTPGPTPPPYLPQTGQLWWPVPALLCGGLFLILIGAVKRRSRNDEEA